MENTPSPSSRKRFGFELFLYLLLGIGVLLFLAAMAGSYRLHTTERAQELVRSAKGASASAMEGMFAMIDDARYAHTNLVARDWRALVRFYQDVFGCVPVPPERDFSGRVIEAGTGVPGARIQGLHLRLPGHGPGGPTLEVFEYSELANEAKAAVNRPGFAHVAFAVPDVPEARAEVLSHGGSAVGEIVTLATATDAKVTWCYVTDPEGNVIELQSWS